MKKQPDILSDLGSPPPAPDDLLALVRWVVWVDGEAGSMDGDLRLTRRQKTAIAALLTEALAGIPEGELCAIAPQLFEPLEALREPHRREFVRRALVQMSACQSVEARALEALGSLHEAQAQWAEAAVAYRRAWAGRPDPASPRLAARLGWAYIKLGQLDTAAAFLEGAVEAGVHDDQLEELLRIARSPSTRA